MTYHPGRQFLQIPGPTNIPERVLRAIAQPVLDHRGPEFAKLASEVLARIKPIFKSSQPVLIFPASGTGAWESALVNTLSPGDTVLGFDSGQFALLWTNMARKLGFTVETLATAIAPLRLTLISRGPPLEPPPPPSSSSSAHAHSNVNAATTAAARIFLFMGVSLPVPPEWARRVIL